MVYIQINRITQAMDFIFQMLIHSIIHFLFFDLELVGIELCFELVKLLYCLYYYFINLQTFYSIIL